MNLYDTIAALSTPPGRGGIGVIRMSGRDSLGIARQILKLSKTQPAPWTAQLAHLVDDAGHAVDQVVVTWFQAPKSYTAEDVVEIACHGAPVVLRHCLDRALTAGARLAEPGEFTLRAYLNGRIDLPQAEAVRDLIEATTLFQARIAARQIEGSLSRRLKPLKNQLLELISLLEAGIDFAEDDISVAPPAEILRRLKPVLDGVAQMVASFARGSVVRAGLTLAIVGRPNVGKSSLFNRLLAQDRAIVTDLPGTTRDLVSEVASIEGIPVKLVDTAGIRQGEGLVETLGIERSFQAMADADVTLVVICEPRTPDDDRLIARAQSQGRWILVVNKCDLLLSGDPQALNVSALTGQGMDALRRQILPAGITEPESGIVTTLRHERLLAESLVGLEQTRIATESGIPHEMLLLDLYGALAALDAITGATTADDILNRIFATFCIGK